MKGKTGIVVVGHGSTHAAANKQLIRFVADLRRRLGSDSIEAAFMAHASPTIAEAVGRLVAAGCTHVYGLSLFLTAGGHLGRDIPAQFRRALRRHPAVSWELSPPLLEQPLLAELVASCLKPFLDSQKAQRTTNRRPAKA
ncbi:MAG: CbiX/SirB N-terminal domain-containing protein [Verrucomicrobiae bacterium]|nr:CbiX/SirB N-terminal domain-containing protein [Verrucomicrobiae bacterium]